MYDAIVIGGGIVGASAAYHLARGGANTLLLDRVDVGRATSAGAGILSPETSGVGVDESWFNYAVECTAYYPTLIGELEAAGVSDTGYAICGKLTVAVDADEDAAFALAKQTVSERQQRRGTPSTDDLYEVSAQRARELFPALSEVRGAFYYRGGARVDGRLLNTALLDAAKQHNLDYREAGADELIFEGDAVIGVAVEHEEITAGRVIIAGGAWTSHFAGQLDVRIPVEPQRGQIIHLRLNDKDTSGWPVITAFHGHYLVAWPGGRIAAGATRETGSGFAPHTTAEGIREVLREAVRVAPGLQNAEFLEARVGLRPATPDHLPVMGHVPDVDNLFIATGMGATGLQLGPYSGKLAADWALGNAITTDLAPFSITRFA